MFYIKTLQFRFLSQPIRSQQDITMPWLRSMYRRSRIPEGCDAAGDIAPEVSPQPVTCARAHAHCYQPASHAIYKYLNIIKKYYLLNSIFLQSKTLMFNSNDNYVVPAKYVYKVNFPKLVIENSQNNFASSSRETTYQCSSACLLNANTSQQGAIPAE